LSFGLQTFTLSRNFLAVSRAAQFPATNTTWVQSSLNFFLGLVFWYREASWSQRRLRH